ncbi:unnamed protein product, partial [marine sediment metagenome]
ILVELCKKLCKVTQKTSLRSPLDHDYPSKHDRKRWIEEGILSFTYTDPIEGQGRTAGPHGYGIVDLIPAGEH